MKRSMRRLRMAAELGESTEQRLTAYALAASATGVGFLALAAPAEAKIIYRNTHHVIGRNTSYRLDLNQDRKTDFTFQNTESGGTCGTDFCIPYFAKLAAKPAPGNGAAGFVIGSVPWAFALKGGARIGPSQYFRGAWMATANGYPGSSSSKSGSWVNVKNRYLGLQFKIGGKIHYGWARLSVEVQNFAITAKLTGYAYETIPNKPIIAGQTKGKDAASMPLTSLGHLAIGASTIPRWRIKHTATTTH